MTNPAENLLEERLAKLEATVAKLESCYRARFPDYDAVNCPHCGARISPQSKSCPRCQQNIPASS